ncbi:MAG: Hsp70 family protein [Candidatus Nanopelagicales bacterium]
MSYSLGVDLGTTFTAAAAASGNDPEMIGLGNRALQVPSVLFLEPGGFLVGEAAERRGTAEPDRLVREFKRRLGDHVPLLVGGSPFSAELLTARLLTWVVATTTERMGDGPGTVVLTHPANWGPYKMDVFRQVATLADVPDVMWLPEPVAAAAQYASRARVEPGGKLAIYDLGGGTFDVCVVEKTGDGFEMLGSPDGVEHLGGADLDHALFERVMSGLGDRVSDLDPDDPGLAIGLGRLRRDCVDAKEALSSDVTAVIPVSLPGLSSTVRVTRSEFEELIRPALEETVAATRRGLSSAHVEPSDLAGIVLIGGSSRIPLVAELLQHEFGIPAALDTHPKHDVALGAARLGHSAAADRPTVSAVPITELSAAADTPAGEPPDPRSTGTILTDRTHVGTREIDRESRVGRNRPLVEHLGGPQRRLPVIVSVAIAALVMLFVVVRVLTGRDGAVVEAGPGNSPAQQPTGTSMTAPLPRSAPLTASQLVIPMQAEGDWNLYLGDANESAPVRSLRSTSAAEMNPVLSPDFSTIAYVHDADTSDGIRNLHVAAAANGEGDRPLFDPVPSVCSGSMNRPAWNPADPTVLAVSCTDSAGEWGLYIITTDGSVIREVTHGEQRVDDPAFAPDGKRLAFWAGPQSAFGGGEIYVANADGSGQPRKLTTGVVAGQDADPTWSPNGLSIAFRRRSVDQTTGGNFDIYTVPADGSTDPVGLATSAADEQDPSWSRFGDWIAFKSNAPTKESVSRIWIMDNDGENKRVLWSEDAPGSQGAPAWSPR